MKFALVRTEEQANISDTLASVDMADALSGQLAGLDDDFGFDDDLLADLPPADDLSPTQPGSKSVISCEYNACASGENLHTASWVPTNDGGPKQGPSGPSLS